MNIRDNIMQILNGRSQFISCDLDKQIAKLHVEKHRNLINIVDQLWDEKGLKGRECKQKHTNA
jgi:hypothetical protein